MHGSWLGLGLGLGLTLVESKIFRECSVNHPCARSDFIPLKLKSPEMKINLPTRLACPQRTLVQSYAPY